MDRFSAMAMMQIFKAAVFLCAFAVLAGAQGGNLEKGEPVSLNNMEEPKLFLSYSNEFPKSGDTLYLNIAIQEGWHINADKVSDDFLVPSSVEPKAEGMNFHPAIFPEPTSIYNEILKIDLLLLQDSFSIAIPIHKIQEGHDPYQAKVNFTYQACSNICLAPKTVEVNFNPFSDSNSSSIKKNSDFAIDLGNRPSQAAFEHPAAHASAQSKERSLLFWIIPALLGGLLLNIMPCVLPILFLKVFDFMRRSGDSRKQMFKWGLATASGIYFSFAVLAAIILLIKLGGNSIGWGFQFQHPVFTASMAMLVGVLTLNMWGVYEIWLPGEIMGKWDKQTNKNGLLGAFFYGALLVLLSTPCSAPLLGSAVGFAFTATVAELLVIFGSIAFGLSLPYLVLGAFPQWTKILPKPGEWMVAVKQFFGFPLLFTAIWLLWVFFKQTGADSTLMLAIALSLAGFFAWISRLWASPGKPWRRFAILWILFIALYVCAWNFLISPQISDVKHLNAEKAQGYEWEDFSFAKLDSLQNEGRAVWINGMADWCITCKVNEKQAFSNAQVQEKFLESEVIKLQADYTHPNREASALFEKYGRSGVPFDLLITSSGKAILLPEFLTADAVLNALRQAQE